MEYQLHSIPDEDLPISNSKWPKKAFFFAVSIASLYIILCLVAIFLPISAPSVAACCLLIHCSVVGIILPMKIIGETPNLKRYVLAHLSEPVPIMPWQLIDDERVAMSAFCDDLALDLSENRFEKEASTIIESQEF